MVTRDNVRSRLATDKLIQVAYVYSSKSCRFFTLIKDIEVELSNGEIYVIPEGLYTDLCSSPKFIWGIFPPYGDFLFASIVHDYLYIKKPDGWNQKKADLEMLFWSKIVNRKNLWQKTDNYLRYYAVRLFGKIVWNKGKS